MKYRECKTPESGKSRIPVSGKSKIICNGKFKPDSERCKIADNGKRNYKGKSKL